MTTPDPDIDPGKDDFLEQRATLRAVLASKTFQKSPRLGRLLEYVCNKYFDKTSDEIKEYSIAVDVFHRPDSFDPASDSIVRVEIFRLRKKLREYYAKEGAAQRLEIILTTGKYLPEFVARTVEALPQTPIDGAARLFRRRWQLFGWSAAVLTVCVFIAGGALYWTLHHRAPVTSKSSKALLSKAAAPAPVPDTVRIRCGYPRPMYRDEDGNVWLGDRDFVGGAASEVPARYIVGTRDPHLFFTFRSGTFAYNIPLQPGTYELHLYFAETTYGPTHTLGGGENSRVFNVQLNGSPLLNQFDIVTDAGTDTADIRIFRNVHPASDGFLHLNFLGVIGSPMVNAIEIIPGIPGRLHTLRMVAQDNFYTDRNGNQWFPDRYFSGGRLAADNVVINGTDDPGLYAGERYGNFSYALPADHGKYALTLHFSEKYFGVSADKNDPSNKRVFDVYCNGVALIRNLDIAKEAGPAHALQKTFHGLEPNAQGKIIVSFVPVENYALVDAVELRQE